MVNLVKNIEHDIEDGAGDNEWWKSRVDLPMYLTTVFPSDMAAQVMRELKVNDPSGIRNLLILEHHYDNATGEFV